MKKTTYKGYIIDKDNLGRTYVYNKQSPYSEDSDKKYVTDYIPDKNHSPEKYISHKLLTDLQAAKKLIDGLINN